MNDGKRMPRMTKERNLLPGEHVTAIHLHSGKPQVAGQEGWASVKPHRTRWTMTFTVEASPQEAFHKKSNPETPGRPSS
eukprot:8626102-Pyramimonas_sp.AAC.1